MITRSTGYTFNVFHGLSTDTKPTTGVVNGDKFVEIDTGDKYVFDGEDLQWVSESGGGGGSGGGVLLVTVDFADDGDFNTELILSATFEELKAAHEAGKEILAQWGSSALYPITYMPAGENDGTPYPENFYGMIKDFYLQENDGTGNQDLIYAVYDYGISESLSYASLSLETTILTQ